ncbi:MAG TPA: ABC transporter ATP-binding protein [Acidimicrobiia bacterium]|nr:ABC transporter ATP-binding protein [Acidimicrobiia bacterium]
MTDSSAIVALGVSKSFGETAALTDFSLTVPRGRVLTLLGPSGCGKTTALRLIAGFERPDGGTIDVGGLRVAGGGVHLAPEKRRVGMVFQDYALFPHLTVAANVAYGLGRNSGRKVEEMLSLVGLDGLQGRLPHELSGGQQQRVALARALAPQPEVILLDEPFSNLDASLRTRVRREVKGILTAAATTALFVTHDQEEALSISDSVAVMRDGQVLQVATPAGMYQSPVDPWVAGFLGEADFIEGHASRGRVDTPLGIFATDLVGPVRVMVRPENVDLIPDSDGDGVVSESEFYGHDQLVTVVLAGGVRVRSRLGPLPQFPVGTRVWVKAEGSVTYPA